MVKKTLNFKEQEWKEIEKEFAKTDLTFTDFVKEKILSNQNSKTDLIDFSELLKNNCKVLDTQIAKYISVLLEKLEKQEKRFNKILENNVYADFKIIATSKDQDKLKDINFYRAGDFLRNKQGILNLILKVNREKEEVLIASYPLTAKDTQTKWVHVKKDVAPNLYEMYRIKKD